MIGYGIALEITRSYLPHSNGTIDKRLLKQSLIDILIKSRIQKEETTRILHISLVAFWSKGSFHIHILLC